MWGERVRCAYWAEDSRTDTVGELGLGKDGS